MTTRRVSLTLDGQVFDEWTRVEITRDLSEISGSFFLELRDSKRSIDAFPFATLAAYANPLVTGLEAVVAIDGEPVLIGHVEEVAPDAGESQVLVSLDGRDRTGDLVDSAASTEGPTEFRHVDLEKIARRAAAPFGLGVRAEVDVGAPFDRYTFDVGETALSAIEKGARQRGVLVTSDGIGNVVLTRSGRQRAPGELHFPGNIVRSGGRFSSRDRHSDYHVKGQAERAAGTRRDRAPLDVRADPVSQDGPEQRAEVEERGVTIHAHVRDDEIRRYRPLVAMARTQLRQDGAERQADWMRRTARAKGRKLDYLVKDFRGATGELWRPNQLVFVRDAFQQIEEEMLIAGVVYGYGDRGVETRLRLTRPEDYGDDQEAGSQ